MFCADCRRIGTRTRITAVSVQRAHHSTIRLYAVCLQGEARTHTSLGYKPSAFTV